ncbi:MAG TPA: DUF4260 domain-containing protein [Rhizobiaceae bacterium]
MNSRTVDFLLRLEWAAVLALAIAAYLFLDGPWQLFVLLILAPDLAMLGYLAGPIVGAAAYNAFHTLVWPVVLFLVGLYVGQPLLMQVAAIWTAHIAMDRVLGYGLKLPSGFTDTHLGKIGKGR